MQSIRNAEVYKLKVLKEPYIIVSYSNETNGKFIYLTRHVSICM